MFQDKLQTKYIGKVDKIKNYELTAPLVYRGHTVPIGFKTNLASIPIWIKWINRKFYYWLKFITKRPSVLHDYLYESDIPRKRCDKIYQEALDSEDINPFIVDTFYLAVRLFGGKNYGN